MNPLVSVVLKRLAWRNKGTILKLVAVVGAAALAALIAIAIVVSSLAGGAFTILAGSEETCQTGGGPDGGGPYTYTGQDPSPTAESEIPPEYLKLYQKAGRDYGLDWTVLAGVGFIESNHGANAVPSSAGAQGPMQFMPETWQTLGVDGNGDGVKDVNDPADAIPAAAGYLKDLGAPGDYRDALCQYNAGGGRQCGSYPEDVLAKAEQYRASEKSGKVLALVPDPSEVGAHLGGTFSETVGATLTPSPAQAAPQGWDLVDSSRNLTYADHTKYNSALSHAASVWDRLGSVNVSSGGGGVDVYVGDGYLPGSTAGLTRTGDKSITLNPRWMDAGGQNPKNAIAGHEFGHALGLGHVGAPSIMTGVNASSSTNEDTPQAQDKRVYYEIWGHFSPGGGGGGEPSGGGSSGGDPSGGGSPQNGTAHFPLPDKYFSSFSDDFSESHQGTDIFAPVGTDVVAIVGGTVVKPAGRVPKGSVVVKAAYDVGPIRQGDLLLHSNLSTSTVDVGQSVRAGESIGRVGSSPEAGKAHLHVGWYDPSGSRAETGTGAMNPYPLLTWLVEEGGVGSGGYMEPAPCPEEDGEPGAGPGGAPDGGGTPQGSGSGKSVVEEAKKYLGTPYVLGPMSDCVPYEAMDCTCLTHHAFKPFGFNLPDMPEGQWKYGQQVPDGQIQAGDLLVWGDPGDGTYGHAGIAIGDGDPVSGGGSIIHANMATMDTSITPMWMTPEFMGARRLVKGGG